MPDMRVLPLAASALLAVLVAGCSDPQPDPSREDVFASDLYSQLLDDAEYEISQGNLSEAGALYDEALEINREDPKLWVAVARLRFRGGEHAQAVEAVDLALRLDPTFAPALLMRGQLVRDANGLEDALVWFETALSYHPQDADLLAEFAATLGDLGRNREMLAVVRQLAEIDPENSQVQYAQAVLAARGGDPLLASNLLQRSGLRAGGVPAAVVLDALIEMEQANYDSAVMGLADLSERQPANMRVQELLARAYWLSARDNELVDRFEDLARAGDASPYLTMLVGRSLERLGERERAADLIEAGYSASSGSPQALPIRPGNLAAFPPQTFALRQMAKLGNTNSIGSYAATLLGQFSGSSDIAALAGDAAFVSGDTRRALALYSRAAMVRRPWPLTKKIIAAYRALNDFDAADALLIRHLKGEPRNTEAMLMLAQRAASDADWDRVTALLDHAISLGAGNDPVLLALRIEAAQAQGDETSQEKFSELLKAMRPAPLTSN